MKHLAHIQPDGRCDCSQTNTCPVGKARTKERCTEAELHGAHVNTVKHEIDLDTMIMKTTITIFEGGSLSG